MANRTAGTNTKHVGPTVRAAVISATPVTPAALSTLRTDPVDGAILDSPGLRGAIKMAKLGHRTPGVQVWAGDAGVGKTVAARQLVHECNANFAAGKADAYRAFYMMTGGDVDHASHRHMNAARPSAAASC